MMRPSSSSNSGSCTGRIVRPRSCRTKQPSQTDPSVSAHEVEPAHEMPSWWNWGDQPEQIDQADDHADRDL
jgi:hypothetical protein